ncbi:MAG: nucleotide sugar dehydrogenase, partial [Candidatus Thermoplasmatota archaeon]|nr:nucleotide sugar dehydrogenase [Candidatus Thermoplasmatota archaeon]
SSTVAVMGASFLQDSGDLRNSPSVPVVGSLSSARELRIHDPYAEEVEGRTVERNLKKAISGADLAVFMVAHKAYSRLTPAGIKKLMRTPVVVDGRNIFSSERMRRAGIVYMGVGKRST